MPVGSWTVADCPACGHLHPVHFDEFAGIDGDDVFDCPVAGRVELSDVEAMEDRITYREVVSVDPAAGAP